MAAAAATADDDDDNERNVELRQRRLARAGRHTPELATAAAAVPGKPRRRALRRPKRAARCGEFRAVIIAAVIRRAAAASVPSRRRPRSLDDENVRRRSQVELRHQLAVELQQRAM